MRRLPAGSLEITVALVLIVATWAAVAPVSATSRELVYVIPAGTSARLRGDQPLDVLPATVRLMLGVQDVLVLANEDGVTHQVGPILLAPRQTYRIPFRIAARFQYACSLHRTRQLTIVVDQVPAMGWARLGWRLSRIVTRGSDR